MLMIYSMPVNIIPFFVLGLSILLFGVRGIYLYYKQKTPLISYFATGAILAGISALFYSVPFVFTQDINILKLTTLLGDIFYFATVIVMTRVIWYLGFHKQVRYIWVLLPYLIAIAGAAIASVLYLPSTSYEFIGNTVVYPVPIIASWFFAAMSTSYVFVGFITLHYARTLNASKQRARLILVGLAFLFGGIMAIANFLFLQGSNTNAFSTLGYIVVAVVLFSGIFLISRSKNQT